MITYKEIRVGDIVECLNTYYVRSGKFSFPGRTFTVAKVEDGYVFDKDKRSFSYGKDRRPFSISEYTNDVILKRRKSMNKIIIEMFPVTKEAVLIEKWFGEEINSPIFKMLIKGKEKELIEEANSLEKIENEKHKNN